MASSTSVLLEELRAIRARLALASVRLGELTASGRRRAQLEAR